MVLGPFRGDGEKTTGEWSTEERRDKNDEGDEYLTGEKVFISDNRGGI